MRVCRVLKESLATRVDVMDSLWVFVWDATAPVKEGRGVSEMRCFVSVSSTDIDVE